MPIFVDDELSNSMITHRKLFVEILPLISSPPYLHPTSQITQNIRQIIIACFLHSGHLLTARHYVTEKDEAQVHGADRSPDSIQGLTMVRSKDLWEYILGETQLSLQGLRKCEGHLSGALRQCG